MQIKGYATITDPGHSRLVEYDTAQCGHCQKVIYLKPGSGGTIYLIPTRDAQHWLEEPGAMCRVCMRPVCLPCHDKGICVPFERMLEESESRDRFLRAAGIS